MALALFDRVQETTTTTGTGSLALAGAVSGFQSFAVVGNGNTCYYTIVDGSAWEVGIGTYSTSGPTLARTTVLSNSSGNTSPITLTAGSKPVFLTYPAEKSVNLDTSDNVSPLGTVNSGTWQGTTVGVAYGGTGVVASSGANSVMIRDANQNVSVNRLNQANTQTTAAGGTTTLTAASTYSQTLKNTGAQIYRMPDATTLSTGVAFIFNNNATGLLTLQDYAAGAIGTITSGGAAELVLLDNSTVGGTWDVHGFLPEAVTWGTNALDLGTTVITGGTWNGGTVTSAYGGTGLTTFAGANNALYSTGASTLTAGTLPAAAGGTGLTSFTANGVVYASSTSALNTGTALTFNGSTTDPAVTLLGGSGSNYARLNFKFSGATDVTGQIEYALFDDYLTFMTSGVKRTYIDDLGNVLPYASASYNLGSSAKKWKDLNLSGTAYVAGDVTLSGGTANGVAYLNGTKVLTTGSALTFDGTNLTVPAEVYRNSDSSYMRLAGGNPAATGASVLMFGATHATNPNRLSLNAPNATATSYIDFSAGNSEGMRLTSTGLGIGTSSPAQKLTVLGDNNQIGINTTGSFSSLYFYSSGTQKGGLYYTVTGENFTLINNGTTGNIIFANNGAERMRIASTGAIGLNGANYGTAGQVLTSGGSSATPTWTTVGGGGGGAVGFEQTFLLMGA